MSNVIPMPSREGNTFETAWSAMPTKMRERSVSRAKLLPVWNAHAKLCGGQERLLEALKRYVASEDVKKAGGKALERWLKDERYDAWLSEADQVVVQLVRTEFSNPILRASFHLRFKDERARRWFDRCRMEDGHLITALGCTREWLEGPFTQWAKLNGLG